MQRISLVVVLLLVVGAVAQTSKTAKTAPKTAQKKSVPATSAKKPEAKSADAAKRTTSAAKKTTSAAKKSTTAAKKTTSTAKKTTSTAKKTTTASRKRVVRKRVQAQPAPERYLEIQEALIARGHAPGPATGVWGNAWADSLKRFQQDQKLEATGKIDALSLIRLGLGPKREVSAAQPAGLEASEPRATAQ